MPNPDARTAAVAAALLGLFVQAKVNPITPTAIMIVALLAGLVCGDGKRLSPRAGRAAASLTAVFSVAAAVLLTRFCVADVRYKTGYNIARLSRLGEPGYMDGVNDIRSATELNPYWLDYLTTRCDIIISAALAAPPAQAAQLLDKAMLLASDAVRMHPGNGGAHYMRATLLAFTSKRLDLPLLMPAALVEIKIASELDPTFTYVMRRRMEIDHALGDQADYESVNTRYRQIIAVAGETAPWEPLFR